MTENIVLRVAQKELRLFFASPVAWFCLGSFSAVTLFIFFWVEAFFARNIADVRPLFEWLPLLLIFLAAALTMRMWSEERRGGTLEHVLTQPVPLWQFVAGKFLACVTLLLLASGAVYGVWPGGLYGLLGSVASGVATHSAVRLVGRDLNLDRLGPMRKKVERQLNRHGFWNLVSFRYLPIPYAIANGLLALTGVRLSLFTLRTAVALTPTAFAWAYFAESIVGASEASRAAAIRNIALGLLALRLLSLVPEAVRRLRRRRRYHRLLDRRRG